MLFDHELEQKVIDQLAGTTGKKARGKDLASKVRLAFDKAFDNLGESVQKDGVTALSEIVQDMLIQDPFKALDTLSRYVPKEMMIEQTSTVTFIAGEQLDVDAWEKQHLDGGEIRTNH